ncbi:hypothetical protein Hanom_Chr16g01433251 [Helianthus anomalus]
MISNRLSLTFEVKIEPFLLSFGIRGSFFIWTVAVFTVTATWSFGVVSSVAASLSVTPATDNHRPTCCERRLDAVSLF